jgi:hypothetical protein
MFLNTALLHKSVEFDRREVVVKRIANSVKRKLRDHVVYLGVSNLGDELVFSLVVKHLRTKICVEPKMMEVIRLV